MDQGLAPARKLAASSKRPGRGGWDDDNEPAAKPPPGRKPVNQRFERAEDDHALIRGPVPAAKKSAPARRGGPQEEDLLPVRPPPPGRKPSSPMFEADDRPPIQHSFVASTSPKRTKTIRCRLGIRRGGAAGANPKKRTNLPRRRRRREGRHRFSTSIDVKRVSRRRAPQG
jgi:hypothetical protein